MDTTVEMWRCVWHGAHHTMDCSLTMTGGIFAVVIMAAIVACGARALLHP